jgi:hypothetical protein
MKILKIVNVCEPLHPTYSFSLYFSRIDKLKPVDKYQRQTRLTQRTSSLPVTILQNNFLRVPQVYAKQSGLQFL